MLNGFAVILTLFSALMTAFAAFFIKKGMDKFYFRKLFTNFILILGVFLYGLGVVLYIYTLRLEKLTILLPLSATAYIWSAIISVKLLKERMDYWKWCSVIGIVLGVCFVALGGL
jgi:drug/metabolite transporter (DMT)-like permease